MKFVYVAFICFVLAGCLVKQNIDPEITKYKISVPESLVKSSGGFAPGIGSGLHFHKKFDNGELEFFAISDRGPNYSMKDPTKIVFFYPKFSPKIVKIRVSQGVAEVTDFMEIKYQGRSISGLNINQNAQDEEFYDSNLRVITPMFGLDTESIATLKNGDLVVGDEYYPSINIINQKTGEIIKRLLPGYGLPELFKNQNLNRGFESVAVAPNGKIYAILEGVLKIDETSNKNAKLIRMVELDLEKSKIRTFAYPFDYQKYKNSSKVKIGDLAAIDNDHFILVEQGKGKDGEYHNIIYKINIKEATDITNIKLSNQKELEYAELDELKNINFISKEFLFNPRIYGWTENKLEGLTVIDTNRIAITNDSDFGITGLKCQNIDCTKMLPIIEQDNLKTNLWIIKFKNNL